jgi:hypothetical protein
MKGFKMQLKMINNRHKKSVEIHDDYGDVLMLYEMNGNDFVVSIDSRSICLSNEDIAFLVNESKSIFDFLLSE